MPIGQNKFLIIYRSMDGTLNDLEYSFNLFPRISTEAQDKRLMQEALEDYRFREKYLDKETPKQREARGEGKGK